MYSKKLLKPVLICAFLMFLSGCNINNVRETTAQNVRETTTQEVLIVSLFDKVEILGYGNDSGPSIGLDLTGYKEYRLVLRLEGSPGTPFIINELYGPAGKIDQLNSDIYEGTLDSSGVLNYRGKFDVFGPKHFFIRVFNRGSKTLKVGGSLYAVK